MEKRPPSPLSITICAFNAVEYTKLLVESIRKHSRYDHEIVIYSDGSTDGTLSWLRAQDDLVWQHDRTNRGICTAMNRAARMASRPYLFFPNTDHVLAPGWDEALLGRLAPRTVVSCQCIEPGIVPVASIFHARNCGTRWDEFDEKTFHGAVLGLSKDAETAGINYPFTLSKALWNEVGGLDERFDPGPANDPDLFYRLHFLGAKMVRAEDVIVYHFSGKSSRMADEAKAERAQWHAITDRNEARFEEKWGERYTYANGGLPQPGPEAERKWRKMTSPPARAQVKTPLRVLLDARVLGPRQDGIGIYVENIVRALARSKDGPQIICLAQDPDILPKDFGSLEKVRIEKCAVPLGAREREREELARIVTRSQAHLIHGPAFALPQGLEIPSVVTVHDLAFLIYPDWYPANFNLHMTSVLEDSLAQASRIIAVSECTKRDLIGRYPAVSPRVTRIYEAAPEDLHPVGDSQLLRAIKEKYAGGSDFVLSVGVQQRRKNAAALVTAFAKARRGLVTACRLLLVGGLECEDGGLKEAIRSNGLEEDALQTGHVAREELAALYSACQLFVYPSLYEGFGLPVLEAMTCGAPVLASDRGSLPEVVGGAAKLFSPESLESFAGAIRELLMDPALREDLRERGKKRVLEFSWDKAAQETLAVYEEALEERQRAPLSIRTERLSPVREELKVPASPRRTSTPRIAIDARLLGHDRVGTGRYTSEILRALLARGKSAEFVLIGPHAVKPGALSDESSIIQHVPAGPETLLDPVWEQFTLPTHLLGCDLYFSPTGITPVPRPCRAVPVIHDLGFVDHPEHYDPNLRIHLERWIRNSCLSANLLIAVSEFTRDRLCQVYGIPRERIRVVHHGRPGNGSSAVSKRAAKKEAIPHDPYLLCVSSFEPNKNLGTVVEAFREIAPEWPGALVLAGRNGRDLDAVKGRIKECRLETRVRLMIDPEDRKIAELYEQATLFLYPSLYEGFGLPLVEAMARGIPVVANRVASCPEVVGEGGLILGDPSPGTWAKAMKKLVGDPVLRQSLSERALARANSFSWSKAADETWAVLEECLEGR